MASFYDTLQEAVEDVTQHGFDTAERVKNWRDRLMEAAESSWSSARHAEGSARAALGGVYRRLVDRYGVLKRQPGIARWNIERVRPQLRQELDKRILAAADLIKLNREEAVAKTLRRFQGWATSIPAGGSEVVDKREVRAEVYKPIQSRTFVERRVATDQGHKLAASINKVVAEGNDAIAAIWRSHFRQEGYDYREDHRERDGKIFLIRNSWAHRDGFVKPGPAGYTDDVEEVGELVSCRCFKVYIFTLGKLPADMLTEKGRTRLAEARAAIREKGATW
jgi:hypothetical protein